MAEPGGAAALLSRDLRPAVLARLTGRDGAAPGREIGPERLELLYRSGCRTVPFDNALRFLALRESSAGNDLLPGLPVEDFFESWLRHGCGGMCVPASAALTSLLAAEGFAAEPHLGRLGPEGSVDHVTPVVRLGRRRLALDTVSLNETLVPLTAGPVRTGGSPHEVVSSADPEGWELTWLSPGHRSLQRLCLLRRRVGEPAPPGGAELARLYETTQDSNTFRRFNRTLYARTNTDRGSIVTVIGRDVLVTAATGEVHPGTEPAASVLAGAFGWSRELLARLDAAEAFR